MQVITLKKHSINYLYYSLLLYIIIIYIIIAIQYWYILNYKSHLDVFSDVGISWMFNRYEYLNRKYVSRRYFIPDELPFSRKINASSFLYFLLALCTKRDKKNISDIACDVQAIIVFKHHTGF